MQRSRTRILIITDSAVLPTGLAETTRLIFGNLLALYPDQYDLHHIGLFHCYAVTETLWPIYPTRLDLQSGSARFDPADKYAQITFRELVPKLKPDIVFAFGDPDRVFHLCDPASTRDHQLILYLNFDGFPLPPCFAQPLLNADLIITKTDFARKTLLHALPSMPEPRVSVLYSPADTHRFRPAAIAEKAQLRRDLFPNWMPGDAFVLGWIGRNQWRKQVWLLYKVIYYLRHGHYLLCASCSRVTPLDLDPMHPRRPATRESDPETDFSVCCHCGASSVHRAEPLSDIFLWLHMTEEPDQDFQMKWLEQQFAVEPGRDLFYTPGYEHKGALCPDDVPTLYQLWDALLFLSGGEGFGLPAWEAMCSGLPVIYTNYSGHAEFLTRANAGLPVGGMLQPEPKTCVWRMIADLPRAIEAVRKLYFDRQLGEKLGENGRAFAEQFKPDVQAQRWHQIFQTAATSRSSGIPVTAETPALP
jgi:glycosyltransferase involved in cell wall biosynthesis